MQTILILTIIVIITLALLVSFSVLFGARKSERKIALGITAIAAVVSIGFSFLAVRLADGSEADFVSVLFTIVGCALIIWVYLEILLRRRLVLDARWLKVLAYALVAALAIVLYMVIFDILLVNVFKIEKVPNDVFVLNYIMIIVVMCLYPVANEVTGTLRSQIDQGQVHLTYIVRRLNKMATEDVSLDELSKFLARHLHFEYIGMIVDGKLYGSARREVSRTELKPLTDLGDPEYGIWQELSGDAKELCEGLGVKAVAELRDAKGVSFGQILVGKPLGKVGFERRDLIQIETIMNLVAAMIDTKAKKVKK